MKEWIQVHPYQALAVGYVLFFAFGTGIWMAAGRDLKDALFTAFAWTLFYWFIALIQIRRRRKATLSLEDHGQTMVYIRYPDSRPGSLASIWNQGIATPSLGSAQAPVPSSSSQPSTTPWNPLAGTRRSSFGTFLLSAEKWAARTANTFLTTGFRR